MSISALRRRRSTCILKSCSTWMLVSCTFRHTCHSCELTSSCPERKAIPDMDQCVRSENGCYQFKHFVHWNVLGLCRRRFLEFNGACAYYAWTTVNSAALASYPY